MALFETPTKAQLISNAADHLKTLVLLNLYTNKADYQGITEISLIAVHMKELTRTANTKYPRIMDKLVLCFNPASDFHTHMSHLIKLDNQVIANSNKKRFDANALGVIKQFLLRQEGPVCLLAHNGFRFDFQVLRQELIRLEQSLNKLYDLDIYCADTLWTFKEMDSVQLGKSNNSVKYLGVSFLDMVYYTQHSLFYRYLGEHMPTTLTAEEKNLYLLELICRTKTSFLSNLCCKKFSQVTSSRPAVVASHHCVTRNPINLQGISTRTFVYLDLETTGLRRPKITEICLIAVHTSALLSTAAKDTPRVQDKLLLVLDPARGIEDIAVSLTQLSNVTISESIKPVFNDETAFTIAQFLEQQCPPVCLVAHNGKNFDFPILSSHLGKNKETFPIFSQLDCSDSLAAMKSLWKSDKRVSENPASKRMPSFRLSEVYQRTFPNLPITFHHAEGDTTTLIQISCAKPGLLNHIEQSKVALTNVEIPNRLASTS